MITDEQFKNLKPGDTLVLEITVAEIALGRIYYNGTNCMDCCYPDEVSLPPKYDPCRLFRKGDVVEPKSVNGRFFDDYVVPLTGEKCIVEKDEREFQYVVISHNEKKYSIDPAYLELVTPVEGLEPYIVRKYRSFYAVEKYNNHKDRPATFDIDFHPHAKEAAEAERDRLNAAYRKEQV